MLMTVFVCHASVSDEEKERRESSSDSEESDWEEVEDMGEVEYDDITETPSTSFASMNHQDSVEINISRPKSKKEINTETSIRREINRFRKQLQGEIHKLETVARERETPAKPANGSGSTKKKKPPPKPKVFSKTEHYWAELYLENEERWIALDCDSAGVDKVVEIEAKCRQPVHYVLALDSENGVKDLTSKYSSGFLSAQIRRLRTEEAWWKETLWQFRSIHRQRDRLENFNIHHSLTAQPIPTTVAELKNHPLYTLKRDLLKFEAIYPPETQPVGHIRKEPIYPRSAVRTLHSKESWIKDARVIRVGEEPYKIVKARPKIGVPKEEREGDRPLPLYGHWQTEDYIPPLVVDGVIPRNEYGNVEVFKPSMIPLGTVHLHVPGLLQVAKRLGIDCAPAMVGWEFHGRGSHPVLDGWIVCEEHKETLLAAWDHMQAIDDKRNKERRQERALKNWRRLTKGLLLRKAMREKFQEGGKQSESRENSSLERLEDEQEDCDKSIRGDKAWPRAKREFGIDDS